MMLRRGCQRAVEMQENVEPDFQAGCAISELVSLSPAVLREAVPYRGPWGSDRGIEKSNWAKGKLLVGELDTVAGLRSGIEEKTVNVQLW